MIKLAVHVLFSFFLMINLSYASVITNLTDEQLTNNDFSEAEDQLIAEFEGIYYISKDGWDIAWASPVNLEFWYGLPAPEFSEFDSGEELKNTLYSPLLQKNWLFFDNNNTDLSHLIANLTLSDFTRKDQFGNDIYIQASQYFNSHFHYVDANNMKNGEVSSQWYDGGFMAEYFGQFETLYVRQSSNRPSTAQVPEPASLLILALGLIVLASRTRLSH